MAEQEPPSTPKAPSDAAPPAGGGPAGTGPAIGDEPASPAANAPADAAVAEPPADTPDTGTAEADLWETFDAVLQAFGAERGAGLGTFWGDSAVGIDGRFAGWTNASGWRCTLQLVRAPEENVVVLIAQGPPLPGGRARVMVLGAFPQEFEGETLRAALEVGYGIGETWGPAEEPPDPSPVPPPETGPQPAP
jgi:hypothetical protein